MLAQGLLRCRASVAVHCRPAAAGRRTARVSHIRASKGFSTDSPEAAPTTQAESATQAQPAASSAQEDELSIESKIRSRRRPKVGGAPKVKVVNATLEAARAAENSPESQAEAAFVAVLALLFVVIILEGLVVAGSGFLSEDLDLIVQNVVYPAFTPTMGLFLATSAFYGLWKTGKLPGQRQL